MNYARNTLAAGIAANWLPSLIASDVGVRMRGPGVSKSALCDTDNRPTSGKHTHSILLLDYMGESTSDEIGMQRPSAFVQNDEHSHSIRDRENLSRVPIVKVLTLLLFTCWKG
jgi:hypothetical protein